MGLKSYRLTLKKKKKKKKSIGGLLVGGATAIIGVGLLGATADAVARI